MSHVPGCMVCGTPPNAGPTVAGKMRPLCAPHRAEWMDSGEWKRLKEQVTMAALAIDYAPRAFQDWLTRMRAERRNHNPEAA